MSKRRQPKGRRFLPTINLWDPAVHSALVGGQLRLQRGQWVRCGSNRPSRYVGLGRAGVIYAVHPDSLTRAAGKGRFCEMVKAWDCLCVEG